MLRRLDRILSFVNCCNYMCTVIVVVFFFKQKTAYEMRISDWSSDVCSSDLLRGTVLGRDERVQEPRILLFPQLPVRGRVEGQQAPLHRAYADRATAPQIRPRLQDRVRRRCLDEPV